LFEERREALLAAIRYEARFTALIAEGYDTRAALCRDVTLSNP